MPIRNYHQTRSYTKATLGIAHFVFLLKDRNCKCKVAILCLLQNPSPFFPYHSIAKSKSVYIFSYCLFSFVYISLNFSTASPNQALKLLQSEPLRIEQTHDIQFTYIFQTSYVGKKKPIVQACQFDHIFNAHCRTFYQA